MFYELRSKVRYVIGLWSFLRRTIDLEEAARQVKASLAQRQANFLRLAERGVYANPDSPFRKLLLHAGIEFADLEGMVLKDGLETALSRLYERGIYITYDEMRGRAPVRRDGLEFMIRPSDLDNPLLEAQYEMQSSGSSGVGSRSFTDLTLLAHEAAHFALHYQAQGVPDNAAAAFWGPVPPSLLGLSGCLRFAKMGRRPVRWFSPTRLPKGLPGLKARLLILYTIFVALLSGKRFPWPTYAPVSEAMVIIDWLSEMRQRGTPALLQITASAATRVCLEANAHGIDISGTLFRVGGEPYTRAKAAVITSAGARGFSGYAATELGMAGLSCAAPGASQDDLHLVTDKLHVLSRDVVDRSGLTIPALVYTTLHPNSRKILLNAESGDCGRIEERDCGCLIGEMGFLTHLDGLYGYDKMTSEGVTFMSSDLFKLVEEVLPARFGGSPTDYQLAEEEDVNGLPYVSIIVAPRVGDVDEALLVAVTLKALAGYDGPDRGPGMAERWRQSDTLRVLRREPFSVGGRKVLPLHTTGLPANAAQAASARDQSVTGDSSLPADA